MKMVFFVFSFRHKEMKTHWCFSTSPPHPKTHTHSPFDAVNLLACLLRARARVCVYLCVVARACVCARARV